MRKITALLLSLSIICGMLFSNLTVSAAAIEPDVEVSSEAVLLIDLDSDKPIYTKNADKQLYPASLTKIMTFLIVMENVPEDQLETKVTAKTYIFDQLYGLKASNADIRHNEEVRIIDLLYALILPSACEAADILADYVGGGDINAFVGMMNDKAKELGMNSTVYTNSHGLHHPDQVTTANDLWKLMDYIMEKYPLFLKVATTPSYQMPATNKHDKPRTIYHTNTMIRGSNIAGKYYSPYVKGIKTGSTSEAGKNLITLGTNNNYNFLLITMHAPTKYESGETISDNLSYLDHKNIYKWAFNNFSLKTIVKEGTTAGQVKVALGKDKDSLLLEPEDKVIALLPNRVDVSSVQKVYDLPETVQAPIKKGDVIGKMQLKSAGEVIGEVNLVASETIERSTILYILNQAKGFFSSVWFKIALVVIVVFLILYITLIVLYNRKKKKMRKLKSRRRL